jgi:protein SCO1
MPLPTMSTPLRLQTLASAALLGVAAMSSSAQEGGSEFLPDLPKELVGVDIVERLDESLPLDTVFTDDTGKTIALRELFDGERPVLLQLGYFRCPLLCNLVLNGMVKALGDLDWTAGDKFRVVAASINPDERHELAAAKKQGYVVEYGRPGVADGWHFLTGPEASSKALADAVGFGYRPQADGEIAHAAAIFVITPDGRVSRYLYGTKYDSKNLRLALLEASEGRIGSSWDRFILWCHVYDPDAGGYVVFAMRVMQIGGVVTLLVLGGGIGFMWWREWRSRRAASNSAPVAGQTG